MDFITTKNLKMIASAGSIRELDLEVYGEGFILRAKMGLEKEVVLKPANAKGARIFRTIESAARFVRRDLGLSELHLKLSGWTPAQRKLGLGDGGI